MAYVTAFSRFVIGILFIYSLIAKLKNVPAFDRAVRELRVVPRRIVPAAVVVTLSVEGLIAVLMLFGGTSTLIGFILALGTLIGFCVVVGSVLMRGLLTPCNCFGVDDEPLTPAAFWRNALFTVVAGAGIAGSLATDSSSSGLGGYETAFASVIAIVFVIFTINMGEILRTIKE